MITRNAYNPIQLWEGIEMRESSFDIFLCVVYAVLIVTATLPRGDRGESRSFVARGRDFGAFFCALLSACFLPWSGASFLSFTGLSSRWWFAAMGLALAFPRPGNGRSIPLRALCAVCTAVVAGALSQFMATLGVPGELPDLESLAMVSRLKGLLSEKQVVAMVLFFFGLAVSFAGVCANDFSGFFGDPGHNFFVSRFFLPVAAFSFSGFLVIVFIPFGAAPYGVKPQAAALANPTALFLLSLLLSRVFKRISLTKILSKKEGPFFFFLASSLLVAAGCYLLLSFTIKQQ
jgi:hypothetical protein